ncbi:MAG TPA: hypothetical protein VIR27_09820 [Mycobacteriales bacterium]
MQDFDTAARRHYEDASLLHDRQRFPNADHLAGFAAECALKSILIGFLDAKPTPTKPVSHQNGKLIHHGHLPKLWTEVVTALDGRDAGTAFVDLLRAGNPYDSWSVDDRYDDGAAITHDKVTRRIATARQILGCLENAKLSGVLR